MEPRQHSADAHVNNPHILTDLVYLLVGLAFLGLLVAGLTADPQHYTDPTLPSAGGHPSTSLATR